jgi:uncharacterized damage-inducible protein DinB
MSVLESPRLRLATQLDAFDGVLAARDPAFLETRPAPGEWSARENLAHLARHATVFLERLQRIVGEDEPRLGRYRAEDDPEWPAWSALPMQEAVARLRGAHRQFIEWVESLSSEQADRVGVHPLFGPMTIPAWLNFFLLHEAHHLYVAMVRVGEASRQRTTP